MDIKATIAIIVFLLIVSISKAHKSYRVALDTKKETAVEKSNLGFLRFVLFIVALIGLYWLFHLDKFCQTIGY